MSSSTPDLQARLSRLERANRRLTWMLSVVAVLGLLGIGWLLFDSATDVVDDNRFVRNVMFYAGDDALFSPREKLDLVRGWPATWSSGTPIRGHMGAHPDGTQAGAQFYDAAHRYAQLTVSETGGSVLHLRDDGRSAFLGTNLYDGQLLLELLSADGQQGVRLGLTADDEPVLDIIRQGVAQSMVASSGVDPSGTGSVGAAPASATAATHARRPAP
ncbi:MAG: hypothetical protein GVY15_14225 [Bacteroidetes bacterium]|jgi:hypothetical protein|nr:hypothetical protein [Bacteroidota bacterium]